MDGCSSVYWYMRCRLATQTCERLIHLPTTYDDLPIIDTVAGSRLRCGGPRPGLEPVAEVGLAVAEGAVDLAVARAVAAQAGLHQEGHADAQALGCLLRRQKPR